MKKMKKMLAFCLSFAMMLSFAQVMAFATNETLPTADVCPLEGEDLNIQLADMSGYGYLGEQALPAGEYTMTSGAVFKTSYKEGIDDERKQAELAKYGEWVCDYRVQIDTPDKAGINGDSLQLVGEYCFFGNVLTTGFSAGIVADSETGIIPDGSYELLKLSGLDGALTYKEVVNNVKEFKCGLINVDDSLPIGTKITVSLVMYDTTKTYRDREGKNSYIIGEPILYEVKREVVAPEDDLTVVIEEGETIGTVPEAVVEGIAPAVKREARQQIADGYLENNTDITTGVVYIEIKIKVDAVENAVPETEKYKLTPIAEITYENKEKEIRVIENDELIADASISATIPVRRKPLGILHKTNEGELVKAYGSNEFEYEKVAPDTVTLLMNHFSTLETVYDRSLVISAEDAYMEDGKGNLRFVTTVYDGEVLPAKFGTWIVPADYLSDDMAMAQKFENTVDGQQLTNGEIFVADVMEIPVEKCSDLFYAKSFALFGEDMIYSDVVSTSVEASRHDK